MSKSSDRNQGRVLITGSSGFLAQHIIPAIQNAGYFVVGVDKRPERYRSNYFIQTDVKDLSFRDLMEIDYVIHLAWRTNIPDCIRHPEESTENNIGMTVHLLEVSKEAGIKKFLFPSTASLYGHNECPWFEDMEADPIEPYSWQKLSCETLCKMYSKDVPCVSFRFFQVFGEYQREDTALSAFFRLKKAGKKITLTETMAQSKFKSGQRDFIYAGDLAKALVIAMESDETGKGEVMNVGTGEIRTMEEIADAIGSEVEWIPRRPHEVERDQADISKLIALGWKPETDVINWIHETVPNL
jgi:nucleoside-diphosphate-sugar epimerase